jgi:hypothetical protein
MKKADAKTIVYNALISYVDDCAGRGTPEAQELEEAWNKLNEDDEDEDDDL